VQGKTVAVVLQVFARTGVKMRREKGRGDGGVETRDAGGTMPGSTLFPQGVKKG